MVSGMAAGFSIANLFFISFNGINTATGVLIGKSLGGGKLEQVRKEKTWMLSAAWVFGIFMTLIGFITTALVPVVYGRLSVTSRGICRSMLIAHFTTVGPVAMYFWVKLLDLGKIAIAHYELKNEKWIMNLTS